MTRTTHRFIPDADAQAVYEPLYHEVYKSLFPSIQPLVDRLSELTHGS
jgi:xylulokinase